MAIANWTIEEVKPGHVRPFYGLRANIPAGWVECDGSNGTPDLRGTYPKGAGAGQEANVTGGALTHSHAQHPATATSAASAGATQRGTTSSTLTLAAHTHNTPVLAHDSPNHEPPYKTCIWIMKI